MTTKDTAHQIIADLVQRFDEQKDSYKKSDYNETLARRDFIDPFFKALGWDIDNSQGYAEAYREVIHEDKIKIGSATKAPDYSFRLPGGKRLFFVEAKKPSVVVKTEVLPAYQVRRYAWSAKLPVSILTDFEEFAVYDCNKKPKPDDKASSGRIKYLIYSEYLKEFDFLWDTFSKERVLKGSFDKYVASDAGKKGTTTVDKEFLLSLDEWRIELAQNIALRNPSFSEDDLNFSVQQTIDRIIFLRIAEDRGVEDYGKLQTALKGEIFYENLFAHFKEADSKYNSGLFDFKRDKLSAALQVDNKVLKNIINELYYPNSPYEFSVLSVEILGSAYEQFLGKQIRLSERHKAVIEEKPEVRKAGGVYYTPQYIVEYIVQQTVGKLVEGKKPEQIKALKIVDPACGSGSFLIGAFQFLLNYHQQYYKPDFEKLSAIASSTEHNIKQRNEAIKERSKLPLTPDGALTTKLKKEILLNNIYGVDIDTQAVEVTKLSLLLKCMEGETQSSINAEMRFGERALPTLDSNIKSGNSLIDLDFYDGEFDFEPGAEKKIKPFSWQKAFPQVFREGGFDVVIGNPPYGANLLMPEDKYFRKNFQVANYQLDTYNLFIEKSVNICSPNGTLGFIIPTSWIASTYDNKFRQYLASEVNICSMVIAPKQTFRDASVETGIIIISKSLPTKSFLVERWDALVKHSYHVELVDISNSAGYLFPIYSNPISVKLVQKIKSDKKCLNEFADVIWGVKVYENGKGTPPQKGDESEKKIFHSSIKTKKTHRPLLGGSEINRYVLFWKGGYVDYGKWLAAPRNPEWFIGERIIVREIAAKGIIQATMVAEDFVFSNSVDGIKVKSNKIQTQFLLGIINSKLISYYHINTSPNAFKGAFPKVLLQDLRELPMPDMNSRTFQSMHNDMVKLVENMLSLNKEKQQTTLSEKLEQLQHRINHTDEKINKLVYELYKLTEEEIKIIESES
jgi:hypothetical protein